MDAMQMWLDEREIRWAVDALFRLTDLKAWDEAIALFVEGAIPVDMTSLAGGDPGSMEARALFAGFATALHAHKFSHHLATNVEVDLAEPEAHVTAQGYSINVLRLPGEPEAMWETWGVYRFPFRRTPRGWRLSGFLYESRHVRGDDAVRTHVLPE